MSISKKTWFAIFFFATFFIAILNVICFALGTPVTMYIAGIFFLPTALLLVGGLFTTVKKLRKKKVVAEEVSPVPALVASHIVTIPAGGFTDEVDRILAALSRGEAFSTEAKLWNDEETALGFTGEIYFEKIGNDRLMMAAFRILQEDGLVQPVR